MDHWHVQEMFKSIILVIKNTEEWGQTPREVVKTKVIIITSMMMICSSKMLAIAMILSSSTSTIKKDLQQVATRRDWPSTNKSLRWSLFYRIIKMWETQ